MKPIESRELVRETIRGNSRLSRYGEYIQYAIEEGYEILPMEAFFLLDDGQKREKKHLILRHDVDVPGISNWKMFEAEKALGLRSTYYFRMSTIDLPLIDEMVEAGFEVGFHCETVSHYGDAHNIQTKEELDMDVLRGVFLQEKEEFEKQIGHKIRSCCGHGGNRNRKLHFTNGQIFDGYDISQLGLLFEAYDKDLYSRFIDSHIMDGPLTFHYGFAYRETISDAIEADHKNIVFLAHPNHWYLGPREKIGYTWQMLRKKDCDTSTRTFKRAYD